MSIRSSATLEYSESKSRLLNAPESATNAIVASAAAAIGAFIFGYCIGFTSPALTPMIMLRDGGAFNEDASLQVVSLVRVFLLLTLNCRCFYSKKLDNGDTIAISSGYASLFGSILNIGAIFGSILGGVICEKVTNRIFLFWGQCCQLLPTYSLGARWRLWPLLCLLGFAGPGSPFPTTISRHLTCRQKILLAVLTKLTL